MTLLSTTDPLVYQTLRYSDRIDASVSTTPVYDPSDEAELERMGERSPHLLDGDGLDGFERELAEELGLTDESESYRFNSSDEAP